MTRWARAISEQVADVSGPTTDLSMTYAAVAAAVVIVLGTWLTVAAARLQPDRRRVVPCRVATYRVGGGHGRSRAVVRDRRIRGTSGMESSLFRGGRFDDADDVPAGLDLPRWSWDGPVR